MKQKNKQSSTLYCFSPPVMIATFVLEIGLFFYVALRYKASVVQRITIITLLMLATFQLAEFNVCTSAISSSVWSRLGFASITALPPLGIHLAYALAKKSFNRVAAFAYATGGLWAATFLLSPAVFSGHQCTGNYVIFQLQPELTGLYPLYYYGWLLAGIVIAAKLIRNTKSNKIKNALRWQIMGYGVFIVPTTLANIIMPSTRSGIPSIMCGFAVFFAIILATRIMLGQKQNKQATVKSFLRL